MPDQKQHETPEALVEDPHQAEHTARSLAQAAGSDSTLQGYEAINDVHNLNKLEDEAPKDDPKTREKGHPVP